MSERSLTLTLESGLTSVTGTVNSVSVTFTQVNTTDWNVVVTKSEDDVYVMDLTLTSSGGSTAYHTIIYYGVHLIFDRTANDVSFAKLHPEYLTDNKGALNYTDLNRIESACVFLQDEFATIACITNITNPKINWIEHDNIYKSHLDKIKDNVNILKSQIDNLEGWETITVSNPINYLEMNIIEKDLSLISNFINLVKSGFIYSGEIQSGER